MSDPTLDHLINRLNRNLVTPEELEDYDKAQEDKPVYRDPGDVFSQDFEQTLGITEREAKSFAKRDVTPQPGSYELSKEQRAERVHWSHKWGNGLAKFGIKTGTAVAGGTAGLLYGIPTAIANGDLNKFFDNDFQHALDNINEWSDDKLRHYYTAAERENGLVKNLGKANLWANDFLGALSFTAGAIISEAIAAGIAVGTMGAGAPVLAAQTANIASRAKKLIKSFQTLSKQRARQQIRKEALNIGRAAVVGASYEAGVEARHYKDEVTETWKSNFENQYGRLPNEAELADFSNGVNQVANGVFAANMALVSAGNAIQFKKFFWKKPKIKPKFKFDETVDTKYQTITGKAVTDPFDPKTLTKKQKALVRGKQAFALIKNPIYEGFVEEGGQSVISKAGSDYVLSKYDIDGTRNAVSLSKSLAEGFAETYGTQEGMDEVLMGVLIGAFGMPGLSGTWRPGFLQGLHEYNQKRNLDAKISQAQAMFFNHSTFGQLSKLVQTHASNVNLGKAEADNIFDAWNQAGDVTYNFLEGREQVGLLDTTIDEWADMINAMNLQEFSEQFGYDNLSEQDLADQKGKIISDFNDKAKKLKKAKEITDGLSDNDRVQEGLAFNMFKLLNADTKVDEVLTELKDIIGDNIDITKMSKYMRFLGQLSWSKKNQQRWEMIEKQLEKLKELDDKEKKKYSIIPENAEKEAERLRNLNKERAATIKAAKDGIRLLEQHNEVGYQFDYNELDEFVDNYKEFYIEKEKIEKAERDSAKVDLLLEKISLLRNLEKVRIDVINNYNNLLTTEGQKKLNDQSDVSLMNLLEKLKYNEEEILYDQEIQRLLNTMQIQHGATMSQEAILDYYRLKEQEEKRRKEKEKRKGDTKQDEDIDEDIDEDDDIDDDGDEKEGKRRKKRKKKKRKRTESEDTTEDDGSWEGDRSGIPPITSHANITRLFELDPEVQKWINSLSSKEQKEVIKALKFEVRDSYSYVDKTTGKTVTGKFEKDKYSKVAGDGNIAVKSGLTNNDKPAGLFAMLDTSTIKNDKTRKKVEDLIKSKGGPSGVIQLGNVLDPRRYYFHKKQKKGQPLEVWGNHIKLDDPAVLRNINKHFVDSNGKLTPAGKEVAKQYQILSRLFKEYVDNKTTEEINNSDFKDKLEFQSLIWHDNIDVDKTDKPTINEAFDSNTHSLNFKLGDLDNNTFVIDGEEVEIPSAIYIIDKDQKRVFKIEPGETDAVLLEGASAEVVKNFMKVYKYLPTERTLHNISQNLTSQYSALVQVGNVVKIVSVDFPTIQEKLDKETVVENIADSIKEHFEQEDRPDLPELMKIDGSPLGITLDKIDDAKDKHISVKFNYQSRFEEEDMPSNGMIRMTIEIYDKKQKADPVTGEMAKKTFNYWLEDIYYDKENNKLLQYKPTGRYKKSILSELDRKLRAVHKSDRFNKKRLKTREKLIKKSHTELDFDSLLRTLSQRLNSKKITEGTSALYEQGSVQPSRIIKEVDKTETVTKYNDETGQSESKKVAKVGDLKVNVRISQSTSLKANNKNPFVHPKKSKKDTSKRGKGKGKGKKPTDKQINYKERTKFYKDNILPIKNKILTKIQELDDNYLESLGKTVKELKKDKKTAKELIDIYNEIEDLVKEIEDIIDNNDPDNKNDHLKKLSNYYSKDKNAWIKNDYGKYKASSHYNKLKSLSNDLQQESKSEEKKKKGKRKGKKGGTPTYISEIEQARNNLSKELKQVYDYIFKEKKEQYFKLDKKGNSVLNTTKVPPNIVKKYNKLIEALQEELKKLNVKNVEESDVLFHIFPAFKIIEGEGELIEENIDDAIETLSKILPVKTEENPNGIITVEELETLSTNMKSKSIPVGRVIGAVMQLAKKRTPGTKFHEAFHIIFRTFLSDGEITDLLNEAKKRWKHKDSDITNLKNQLIKAGVDITKMQRQLEKDGIDFEQYLIDLWYEEKLADTFETFKPSDINKSSRSIKISWLPDWANNIINRILKFLGFVRENEDLIENLFRNIHKGKYQKAEKVNNIFRKLDKYSVYKLIEDKETGEVYSRKITSTIIGETVLNVLNSGRKRLTQKTFNEAINKVKDKYNDENLKDVVELVYDTNYSSGLELENKIHHVKLIIEEHRDDIYDQVSMRLKALNIQDDDLGQARELLDELEEGENADSWRLSMYEIGGYLSMSKQMRQYIALVETEVDVFDIGKHLMEETRTMQEGQDKPFVFNSIVSAATIYSGLVRALSGKKRSDLWATLETYSKYNEQTRAFKDRMLNDIIEQNNLDIADKEDIEKDLMSGNYEKYSKSSILADFLSTFHNVSGTFLFARMDKKNARSDEFNANSKDVDKQQFRKWVTNHRQVLNEKPKIKRKEVIEILDSIAKEPTYKTKTIGDMINHTQTHFRDLGIDLSKGYIEYSIIKWLNENNKSRLKGESKEERDRKKDILRAFKGTEGIFDMNFEHMKTAVENSTTSSTMFVKEKTSATKDVEDDNTGATTILLNLAKNNALFDETVGESVFTSAEDKKIYDQFKPSYIFELVQEIARYPVEFSNILNTDDPVRSLYDFLDDLGYGITMYQAEKTLDFWKASGLITKLGEEGDNTDLLLMLEDIKLALHDGLAERRLRDKQEDSGYWEDNFLGRRKGKAYRRLSSAEAEIYSMILFDNTDREETQNKKVGKTKKRSAYFQVGILEDKSTALSVKMPVLRNLFNFKKGKLGDTGYAKLKDTLEAEYKRIQKVAKEVQDIDSIPEYDEAYHGTKDELGRGRKLFNFKDIPGLEFIERKANELNEDGEPVIDFDDLFEGESLEIQIGEDTIEITSLRELLDIYAKQMFDNYIDYLAKKGIIFKDTDSSNEYKYETQLLPLGFRKRDKDGDIIEIELDENYEAGYQQAFRSGVDMSVLSSYFFNDYFNTMSFNYIVHGDMAMSFKDNSNVVKRNGGLVASGSSLSMDSKKRLRVVNLKSIEAETQNVFDELVGSKNIPTDRTDGQSVGSINYLRTIFSSLGKNIKGTELLDKKDEDSLIAIDKILDKIEKGFPLTKKEKRFLEVNNATIQPKKTVLRTMYTYHKTSLFIPGRNDASKIKSLYKKNGEPDVEKINKIWENYRQVPNKANIQAVINIYEPRKGREVLHDMLNAMLRKNIDIFVFDSALKTFKPNVAQTQSTADKVEGTLRKNMFTDNTIITDKHINLVPAAAMHEQVITDGFKRSITHGTQSMQLIWSEQSGIDIIVEGKKISATKAGEVYRQKLSERVYRGLYTLDELLKEASTGDYTWGKLLKSFLKNLNVAGEDPYIYELFQELEDSGEPVYNLNLPAIRTKFIQMYLAYISKAMKFKTPGRKYTLVSDFWYKKPNGERLQWGKEEDGNFYAEAVVSQKSLEVNNINEKDIIRNNDGIITGIKGEGASRLLKQFGVRIPTQEKHSMIVLKIVDTVDSHQGNAIMLPYELILYSGADFDIDSLYVRAYNTFEKNQFYGDYYKKDIDEEELPEVLVEEETAEDIVVFTESSVEGYPQRTTENAANSDITIDFSTDPELGSGGTKGTRGLEEFNTTKRAVVGANKKYIGIQSPSKSTQKLNKTTNVNSIVDQIIEESKKLGKKELTLNIAGNRKAGNYTQNRLDKEMFDLMSRVVEKLKSEGITIQSIRSGGQIGYDEAGSKAAMKLGIKAIVHAPKGYMFDYKGKHEKKEKQFKERFKDFIPTTQPQVKAKPENISSKGSAFAKKLTNPGNNLKVTYKEKTFRNAEHAYQTWKSGEFDEVAYKSKAFKPIGSKAANRKTNYQTMVEILTAKLEQHPELIQGINERGGLSYIEQSTHNVTGDKFWESKGENKFIKALADAYKSIQPTTKQKVSRKERIISKKSKAWKKHIQGAFTTAYREWVNSQLEADSDLMEQFRESEKAHMDSVNRNHLVQTILDNLFGKIPLEVESREEIELFKSELERELKENSENVSETTVQDNQTGNESVSDINEISDKEDTSSDEFVEEWAEIIQDLIEKNLTRTFTRTIEVTDKKGTKKKFASLDADAKSEHIEKAMAKSIRDLRSLYEEGRTQRKSNVVGKTQEEFLDTTDSVSDRPIRDIIISNIVNWNLGNIDKIQPLTKEEFDNFLLELEFSLAHNKGNNDIAKTPVSLDIFHNTLKTLFDGWGIPFSPQNLPSVNTRTSKAKAREDQTAGGQGIGPSANYNTMFRKLEAAGVNIAGRDFTNDLPFRNNKEGGNGKNNMRVNNFNSAFLSGMTDNANEQIAAMLNISTDSITPILLMLSTGIPLTTVALMLKQDAQAFTAESLEKGTGIINKDSRYSPFQESSNLYSNLAEDFFIKYEQELEEIEKSERDDKVEDKKLDLDKAINEVLTEENLIEAYHIGAAINRGEEVPPQSMRIWQTVNMTVFRVMEIYDAGAKEIFKLQQLSKLIQGMQGGFIDPRTTLESLGVIMNEDVDNPQEYEFTQLMKNGKPDNRSGIDFAKVINTSPHFKSLLSTGAYVVEKISPNYLLEFTSDFHFILKDLFDNIEDLALQFEKENMIRALIQYITQRSYQHMYSKNVENGNELVDKIKPELHSSYVNIIGRDKDENLVMGDLDATQTEQLTEDVLKIKALKNNFFLKNMNFSSFKYELKTKESNAIDPKEGIPMVFFNFEVNNYASSKDSVYKEKMQEGFEQLVRYSLSKGKKNKKAKELVDYLLAYLHGSRSLAFFPGSYVTNILPKYMKLPSQALTAAQKLMNGEKGKIEFNDKKINLSYQDVFGMSKEELARNFTELFLRYEINAQSVNKVDDINVKNLSPKRVVSKTKKNKKRRTREIARYEAARKKAKDKGTKQKLPISYRAPEIIIPEVKKGSDPVRQFSTGNLIIDTNAYWPSRTEKYSIDDAKKTKRELKKKMVRNGYLKSVVNEKGYFDQKFYRILRFEQTKNIDEKQTHYFKLVKGEFIFYKNKTLHKAIVNLKDNTVTILNTSTKTIKSYSLDKLDTKTKKIVEEKIKNDKWDTGIYEQVDRFGKSFYDPFSVKSAEVYDNFIAKMNKLHTFGSYILSQVNELDDDDIDLDYFEETEETEDSKDVDKEILKTKDISERIKKRREGGTTKDKKKKGTSNETETSKVKKVVRSKEVTKILEDQKNKNKGKNNECKK